MNYTYIQSLPFMINKRFGLFFAEKMNKYFIWILTFGCLQFFTLAQSQVVRVALVGRSQNTPGILNRIPSYDAAQFRIFLRQLATKLHKSRAKTKSAYLMPGHFNFRLLLG